MKTGKSIVKNTAAMLLGTLIRMSASFLLVVFVARKLGSSGMGEFSLILSLFWIFQTIASMGIQPLLIRESAAQPERTGEIISNAAFLSICASVLMSVSMVVFSIIAGYSHTIQLALYWMSLTLILTTVSIVIQAIFIAWEKAELVMIGMTWESAVRLGVGIFVLFLGKGLVFLSAVYAFSALISLVINLFLLHKHITRFSVHLSWPVCKWLVRLVPTFAGISIFNSIFWHVGTIMMSKLTTMEQVGLYSASMRIVTVVKLVLQSYKVAIQPVAVKTFQKSVKDFQAFCEKSLKYVFMLTFPVCAGVLILSEQILVLVFGAEFLDSSDIFRIQVFILMAYGVTLVLASFLIASRHQNIDMRINGISMVVNGVFGYFLISFFGMMGGAVALLISIHIFMAQQILFIRRHLFRIHLIEDILKILAASILMAGAARILSFLPVLINVFVSAVIYVFLLFIMKSLNYQELREMIQIRKAGN